MKAYVVEDKYDDEGIQVLAYSPDASGAKNAAKSTECLCDSDWVDLRARRAKYADDTDHLNERERICFQLANGWWYEIGDERWDEENWRDFLGKLTKIEQNRVKNALKGMGGG